MGIEPNNKTKDDGVEDRLGSLEELDQQIVVQKLVIRALEGLLEQQKSRLKDFEEAREDLLKAQQAHDKNHAKDSGESLYFELPPPNNNSSAIFYWLEKQLRQLQQEGAIRDLSIRVLGDKTAYSMVLLNQKCRKDLEGKFKWARETLCKNSTRRD
jgi:hypothetical protein